MVFEELIEYCRIKAISEVLSPTLEGQFRAICRAYSQKFHTSLYLVLKMDPEHVLTEYFENRLEGVNLEENIHLLLEEIKTIEDPDYKPEDNDEGLDDFIATVEAKEAKRLKLPEKTLSDKEKLKDKKKMGGKVDFSNLDEDLEK